MNIPEEKIVGNIVTCNPYATHIRYSEMFENQMNCLNDFKFDERGVA